jgi:hypothetical protein
MRPFAAPCDSAELDQLRLEHDRTRKLLQDLNRLTMGSTASGCALARCFNLGFGA